MKAQEEFYHTTLEDFRWVWQAYSKYCIAKRRDALPSTHETFLAFIESRSATVKAKTLKKYALVIRRKHTNAGYTVLDDPRLDVAIENIARRQCRGKGSHIVPFRWREVVQLVESFEEGPHGMRDRALVLLMYFGMLHREEASLLDVEDILWTTAGIILHCKGRHPRRVAISMVQSPYCPVRALHKWLSLLPQDQGWLFPSIQNRKLGGRLSARAITMLVRNALKDAGMYRPSMGAGGLRWGAIHTAFMRNVPTVLIAQQAGFRRSNFVQRWAEFEKLLNPMTIDKDLVR